MAFTSLHNIPLRDLKAMADGSLPDTITDMDFIETLASRRCFLVAPWVMHAGANGSMAKVTRLIYTVEGELDKARILVNVARQLKAARITGRFGPRFSV